MYVLPNENVPWNIFITESSSSNLPGEYIFIVRFTYFSVERGLKKVKIQEKMARTEVYVDYGETSITFETTVTAMPSSSTNA